MAEVELPDAPRLVRRLHRDLVAELDGPSVHRVELSRLGRNHDIQTGREPWPSRQRKTSASPDWTEANVGLLECMPPSSSQAKPLSHPSASNQSRLADTSETLRIGVRLSSLIARTLAE